MQTDNDYTTILSDLSQILEDRKSTDPQTSYVASLYDRGLDVILKKVGEEASETIIAAKNDDANALLYEVADLWFHTMVLLAHKNLTADDVLKELNRRFGTSGITEKQARNKG